MFPFFWKRDPRRPFLVKAPPYVNGSAGARVLHLLVHHLNSAGERAFVIADHKYQVNRKLNTPWVKPARARKMAANGAVLVYPEIEHGNPFNAQTVVRYVLNRPGLLGGDAIFDETEWVFVYSKALLPFVANKVSGLLVIPSVEPEIFNTQGSYQRDLTTYYVGKGVYRDGFVQRQGPKVVEITRMPTVPDTREKLAELFKRSQVFYCFDMFSVIAFEARLCGCPVVMVPDAHYTPAQIESIENGFDGVTFENTPEAIAAAVVQLPLAQAVLNRGMAEFKDQLRAFIAMLGAGT